MKLFPAAVCAAALLTGCASVVNESMQPTRIETRIEAGELVTGAQCEMTNDFGQYRAKSGDIAQVHRSAKDLQITCSAPGKPDATANAISRGNMGLAGNILIGGGIGAIIDHNRGTAYTYPTWIQLVFGRKLVFDRKMEKDGAPVPPLENTEIGFIQQDAATARQ